MMRYNIRNGPDENERVNTMSYCRVCGDDRDVRWYATKRQFLCRGCAATTPRKVSRSAFDRLYWDNPETIPDHVKREFYSDYLTTALTVREYRERTTSTV